MVKPNQQSNQANNPRIWRWMIFFSFVLTFYAFSVTENWDSGTTAGWIGTNVDVRNTDGNPGGYLYTCGTAYGSFDLEALTDSGSFTGNFITAGIKGFSVDIKFISGAFDAAWIRFRYKDFSHNGWMYPLTSAFSADEWRTYSVAFDPEWSDEEARSAGWLTDKDVFPAAYPSEPFSVTMSDVYTTEMRLSGEGFLEAGIDNFSTLDTNGTNYGLFVGSNAKFVQFLGWLPNNAHADAEGLMKALSRNMQFQEIPPVDLVMKLNYDDGAANENAVKDAIRTIGQTMTSLDKFIFYYSGHGATGEKDPGWEEVQALSIGKGGQFWDSELTTILTNYFPAGAKKIIILDTCYAGGFWDELKEVKNVVLMASAGKTNNAFRYPLTGRQIYTNYLINGLTPFFQESIPKADEDENGLTFKELHDWAFDWLFREYQEFQGEDLPVADLYMAEGTATWDLVDSGYFGPDAYGGDATQENSAPCADAGPDQYVFTSRSTASVELNGEGSFDPDSDALAYAWKEAGNVIATGISPTVQLSIGEHKISLFVNDGEFDSVPDEILVRIDNQPCGPEPDIKANGSDDPIIISRSEILRVGISLDAKDFKTDIDGWLVANTPKGIHSYDKLKKTWEAGLFVTYQGPIRNIRSYQALNVSALPVGDYMFYIAVDEVMNGKLNKDRIVYDLVKVKITK